MGRSPAPKSSAGETPPEQIIKIKMKRKERTGGEGKGLRWSEKVLI